MCFGIAAEVDGLGRDGVEGLADGIGAGGDGAHDDLRDVIGMDVVHGFEPEIGEHQRLAAADLPEHFGVEVAGGIERRPAGADDVAGAEDGRWEAGAAGLVEEEGLDGGLLRAVFAEAVERLILGGGDRGVVAIDPDGAAMEEVLHPALQRRHQMLGAGEGEADHVDDDIGTERGNGGAEGAVALSGVAVDE